MYSQENYTPNVIHRDGLCVGSRDQLNKEEVQVLHHSAAGLSVNPRTDECMDGLTEGLSSGRDFLYLFTPNRYEGLYIDALLRNLLQSKHS